MANWWFGLVVWIPEIPLWKGLVDCYLGAPLESQTMNLPLVDTMRLSFPELGGTPSSHLPPFPTIHHSKNTKNMDQRFGSHNLPQTPLEIYVPVGEDWYVQKLFASKIKVYQGSFLGSFRPVRTAFSAAAQPNVRCLIKSPTTSNWELCFIHKLIQNLTPNKSDCQLPT